MKQISEQIRMGQGGGSQREQFEDFHLQNDELDPYMIVVLSQL